MQKSVFRVYFVPEKTSLGCVLKVLLRGWYPAWNTSAPPGKIFMIRNIECKNITEGSEEWS